MVSSDRSRRFALRHVTNPHADSEKLTFLEPNLAFDVAARTGDSVTVRTYFELEARPSDLVEADEDACWIDLEVAPGDLADGAQTRLADLEEFPTRS